MISRKGSLTITQERWIPLLFDAHIKLCITKHMSQNTVHECVNLP